MLKTNTLKTRRAPSAKASPRQAATRAAARTAPWAGRLQTALVCVFLTRILYLPPTAAGSRGDTHAIQDGLRAAPRPWRGQIHPRRIRSSKIWKAGKCANTPAEHATLWRHSRGNRHCGNRYCGIRDQGPESSGIGQWHPAPAAVIRKIRCASPLVLLAPGPAGHWPDKPEPDTPEPRFLDIFQDCMLADDGKGPDAQRPARRGSTQIIPLYTPPSTRRLEARTA